MNDFCLISVRCAVAAEIFVRLINVTFVFDQGPGVANWD